MDKKNNIALAKTLLSKNESFKKLVALSLACRICKVNRTHYLGYQYLKDIHGEVSSYDFEMIKKMIGCYRVISKSTYNRVSMLYNLYMNDEEFLLKSIQAKRPSLPYHKMKDAKKDVDIIIEDLLL